MSSTAPSLYFLVDCNQFFVSCEQLFNPRLHNQPVVVLSNNDGCVVARSKEAKKLGIPMGAPHYQYRESFKRDGVFALSSNYTLYADISRRVMEVLSSYSSTLEQYSIDEAFLRMAIEDPLLEAEKIRNKVFKWTGILVSIGIGTTKTLAKVAGDLAKRKARGIKMLSDPLLVDQVLATLTPSEIWGIGKSYSEKLKEEGIFSALEFKNTSDALLKKVVSINGVRTAWELRGTPCSKIEENAIRQSITCSRSFGSPVTSKKSLAEALSFYTATAAVKLRSQNSLVSSLSVFVTTSRFAQSMYYANATTLHLSEPSDFTPFLIEKVKGALDALYREGYHYKKVGIIFMELVPKKCYQLDLFQKEPLKRQKQAEVMALIDDVNQRRGKRSLYFAAEGIEQSWRSKKESSSACFTTRWDELLMISI